MKDETLKAIGADKLTVGWIVDEFDESFDTLAMASLRWHLYYSHCSNEGEYGNKLRALLEDFEDFHRNTYESAARRFGDHLGGVSGDWIEHHCAECDEYLKQMEVEEDQDRQRQNTLRHRFIDILPGLWS